jgi:hypothetical protein
MTLFRLIDRVKLRKLARTISMSRRSVSCGESILGESVPDKTSVRIHHVFATSTCACVSISGLSVPLGALRIWTVRPARPLWSHQIAARSQSRMVQLCMGLSRSAVNRKTPLICATRMPKSNSASCSAVPCTCSGGEMLRCERADPDLLWVSYEGPGVSPGVIPGVMPGVIPGVRPLKFEA